MARKPRTPDPPRRVQAPKQRHTPRKPMDPARQRTILYGVAAAGLVGLAVALIVVFVGGKGGGSEQAGSATAVAATIRAEGCTLTTSKASPSAQHTSSLDQSITYPSFPPVSGRHYVNSAIWGNYTQAVDPRQALHNMEHGGVVVWVGPKVPEAERQQISDFYNESPNGILVTPIDDTTKGVKYPKHAPAGSKTFLTAWTVEISNGNVVKGTNVTAACPHFSEKAFTAFRDEFRGTGPERFPVNTLSPGT